MVCGLGIHFHLKANEVDIVWLPARFMGILLTLRQKQIQRLFRAGGRMHVCICSASCGCVGAWVCSHVAVVAMLFPVVCFQRFLFCDVVFVSLAQPGCL